ncbi:Abi family protein [Burkholderia gladioli]|nr:Abi family protein [Burkholderia gladioli]
MQKLKAQGLTFSNESAAEAFLKRVSYFRFRGYLYPYFDLSSVPPAPRKFKPASTFEKALEMYLFDEGLRTLLFQLLPRVEVALRTVLDATVSAAAGHGFWYIDPAWFKKGKFPERVISALQGSFCRSSEAYAVHYHATYYNQISSPFKGLPPFWVVSELSTLGQLKEFFENLREDAPGYPLPAATPAPPKSTPLDKMAHGLGAPHFRDLVSWVSILRDVRNICAHHSRLWNRNFRAPAGITSKVSVPFPLIDPANPATFKINTVYAAIVVLRLICKPLAIADNLYNGLLSLLTAYPEAQTHLSSMGIPTGWDGDLIWK